MRLRILGILILMICPYYVMRADGTVYNEELPQEALVEEGYTPIDAENYIKGNAVLPIEGIWEYVDDMMQFSIERLKDNRFSPRYKYRIVLLDADDKALEPGTIMGYIEETAKSDKFYIWLYSEVKDNKLYSPRKCIANMSANTDELIFEPNNLKFKWRINFARFMPSFFRGISLYVGDNGSSEIKGFRRIYPKNLSNPSINSEIIYL